MQREHKAPPPLPSVEQLYINKALNMKISEELLILGGADSA